MIEGDDLDTETDFIKRVESDFEKTRRDAAGMKKLNTIVDGISGICILVLMVLFAHKGVQFLLVRMNEAYDAGAWSWYLIYTSTLILCGSMFLKIIIKGVQGTYEDN